MSPSSWENTMSIHFLLDKDKKKKNITSCVTYCWVFPLCGFDPCLSLFQLLQQRTIDCGAYKEQRSISHNSGACKSKTKSPTDSVWWGPSSWFTDHISSLCLHMREEVRGLPGGSFIRALINSLGPHSHDLIPPKSPTSKYHPTGG